MREKLQFTFLSSFLTFPNTKSSKHGVTWKLRTNSGYYMRQIIKEHVSYWKSDLYLMNSSYIIYYQSSIIYYYFCSVLYPYQLKKKHLHALSAKCSTVKAALHCSLFDLLRFPRLIRFLHFKWVREGKFRVRGYGVWVMVRDKVPNRNQNHLLASISVSLLNESQISISHSKPHVCIYLIYCTSVRAQVCQNIDVGTYVHTQRVLMSLDGGRDLTLYWTFNV